LEKELPKVKEIWMSIEKPDKTISNKTRPTTTGTTKKTVKELTNKVITKKSSSNIL
jgi:hypothetical protein